MKKSLFIIAFSMLFALVFAGMAFSQVDDDAVDDDAMNDDAADDDADDDDVADDDVADDDAAGTFTDSTVTGYTDPEGFEADTQYEFTFEVFNAETPAKLVKGIWIKQVEIALPSADYTLALEADQPAPPDCQNPETCDYWTVVFDTTNNEISWQSFGSVTTVEYGDIREGDVQSFSFIATTDGAPSDGFAWTLWGDNDQMVNGVWFFAADDDTVDDDIEPDDDEDDSGDDDDDGCGC